MYTQDLAACILCEIILDGRPHAMLLDHTQLIPTHPEYIHATSRTLPIPPNAPYYLGCLTMLSGSCPLCIWLGLNVIIYIVLKKPRLTSRDKCPGTAPSILHPLHGASTHWFKLGIRLIIGRKMYTRTFLADPGRQVGIHS